MIRYQAPWDATAVMDGTVDVIFSHSVLQYVEDLDAFYSECRRWLKPDGWMSHHIDLSSMNVTRVWNAHWSYSPRLWKTVRGARPFFLTARTSSEHAAAMDRNGFRLCKVDRAMEQGIAREQLSEDRRGISDEDLDCKSMFAIVKKSGSARRRRCNDTTRGYEGSRRTRRRHVACERTRKRHRSASRGSTWEQAAFT